MKNKLHFNHFSTVTGEMAPRLNTSDGIFIVKIRSDSLFLDLAVLVLVFLLHNSGYQGHFSILSCFSVYLRTGGMQSVPKYGTTN